MMRITAEVADVVSDIRIVQCSFKQLIVCLPFLAACRIPAGQMGRSRIVAADKKFIYALAVCRRREPPLIRWQFRIFFKYY